jgi:hypothetical protein
VELEGAHWARQLIECGNATDRRLTVHPAARSGAVARLFQSRTPPLDKPRVLRSS